MKGYTVGALARLSRVSVRTLHHYDSVGLLKPSGRSAAGHRLCSDTNLSRLRQIIFYRELEFRSSEIQQILANPDAGSQDRLRRQHRRLRERQTRNQPLLGALEKEMEARKRGISLTAEEQFEILGTDKLGAATAGPNSAGATPRPGRSHSDAPRPTRKMNGLEDVRSGVEFGRWPWGG